MKRIIAFILILVLLLGICGCSNKKVNSSVNEPPKETVSSDNVMNDVESENTNSNVESENTNSNVESENTNSNVESENTNSNVESENTNNNVVNEQSNNSSNENVSNNNNSNVSSNDSNEENSNDNVVQNIAVPGTENWSTDPNAYVLSVSNESIGNFSYYGWYVTDTMFATYNKMSDEHKKQFLEYMFVDEQINYIAVNVDASFYYQSEETGFDIRTFKEQ